VHRRTDDGGDTRAGDVECRRRAPAEPATQQVAGQDLGERGPADVSGAHEE
jgi:hypothetical protein